MASKVLAEAQCAKCGEPFNLTRRNQKYCPKHRTPHRTVVKLGRPIKCAKCGEPFTRTHGKQKLCIKCRPAWVNARSAARAATRPARLDANRVKRSKQLSPKWAKIRNHNEEVVLGMLCSHKVPLGECTATWCRSRAEDIRANGYSASDLAAMGRPEGTAARPREG